MLAICGTGFVGCGGLVFMLVARDGSRFGDAMVWAGAALLVWSLIFVRAFVVTARSYERHRREAGVRFRAEVAIGRPLWCPGKPLSGNALVEDYELHEPGVLGLTADEVVFLSLARAEVLSVRRVALRMMLQVSARHAWPRKDIRGVEALPPSGLRMALWGVARVRLILEEGHVDFPTLGARRMAELLCNELREPV